MRTRTLLILAVVCGLAILVAGSIQLLRVTGGDDRPADLSIGERGTAGDLTAMVVAAAEDEGRMVVTVTLGGVDDERAVDGFVLLAGAEIRTEPPSDGDRACRSVTVAEQTCDLVFDTSDVRGSARVLRLRRGEDQVRWALT